mgnify:CR=1 FL=1
MKKEIIDIALLNLVDKIQLAPKWKEKGPLDGTLTFQWNGRDYPFIMEVKKEVRQHQVYQLEKYKDKYQDIIVVAECLFPKIKEHFRALNIAYLEANGNFFMKTDQFYFFIDTNDKLTAKRETANRAFTKTGLKVLFQFLQDPDLINKPQREIAEKAGVGLGNIPQVIDGLKQTGYIITLKKNSYLWENRKGLLNRWIDEYDTVLRPKLLKGKYTLKKSWGDIDLHKGLTAWGGEPAADILTHYLRPEKFTLYTKETQRDLLKNYRIVPRADGELEVLEMFWPQDVNKNTAPPILIYAELLLEGGKRNKETAELIFNEHIKQKL